MTEPVSNADLGDAEPVAAPKPSTWQTLISALSPKTVWHMADGQPVVLKQFVQFCLILVYPGWVLGVLGCLAIYGLFYITVYPVLWVLFWPMRAWMKKNRPEEYAESQRKK
jgi:YggT family protein